MADDIADWCRARIQELGYSVQELNDHLRLLARNNGTVLPDDIGDSVSMKTENTFISAVISGY